MKILSALFFNFPEVKTVVSDLNIQYVFDVNQDTENYRRQPPPKISVSL